MIVDEIIRNKIKNKIPEKKVRNIFFVCSSFDGKNVYAIVGNNNKIFGIAIISNTLEIEEIII